MYGLLTDFILLCTCNLYPVFASFKAIRSRDGDEWARWMMYFICFSLFKVATHLTDYIFFWLPFYEIAKLGFAIWLLPVFGGSKVFYQRLVHLNLLKYEIEIDLFIASISSRAISLGRILFSFALQKTTEKLEQAPQLMGMAMNLMAEQQLRQKEQQQQQQQQRVIQDIPQHSIVTEDDRIGNNNEPLEFSDEDDSARKNRSYSPPQLINVNQDPQILSSPSDDKFLSSDNDDLQGATTATLSTTQTKQKQPTRRLASKYQNSSDKRKTNNNDDDDDAKIRSNTYESSTLPRVKKLRDRKTNDV